MSARRWLLATLAVCTFGLLIAAPAATAAVESHPFLVEKKQVGSDTPGGGFEGPCGVAVDSSGYVYVSDYYHDAIDIFSSFNLYVGQIPNVDPGNGPCAIAVSFTGDIYVNEWRQGVVKFVPSSYPPSRNTQYTRTVIDESGTATGVAYDPLSGDVYVDDGSYIGKYTPSGEPVEVGGEPVRIGEGTLGEGFGLAESFFGETPGYLYVADAATDTVKVYDPATDLVNPVSEIDGAGTPQGKFDYLVDAAVAVNANDGHVFVVDTIEHGLSEHPEAVVDEFNTAGDFRSQISHWVEKVGDPPILVERHLVAGEPSGLAVSQAEGNVYVTNGNDEGAELDVFGPAAAAETLTVSKEGAGGGTVASKPAGIDCGAACVAEYDAGQTVKLTATPDSHSTFSGWSGAGCSGTEPCFVSMSEAQSVTATFAAIPQQNLIVSVGGSGAGTVTSSPAGIDCSSGSCEEHFNEGSTVTLTATPAPHSRFAGWSGPDCDESVELTCQVTMTEAKAVAAQFEAIPQLPLEVTVSGPGSVTSSPTGIACGEFCSEEFDEGSTVTLTAQPQAHNQVMWKGCTAVPEPDSCEVKMSAAATVSAAFGPIFHQLTVNTVGAGSVTADRAPIAGCGSGGPCSASYEEGETIALSATPSPGYLFAGWSGACGGTAPCHLTLEADSTLTANFAAIPPVPIPASLKLGKVSVQEAKATIRATVSGPGTLAVAGAKAIEPESLPVAKGGATTIRFALSAKGRKALRHSRSGRLKLPVVFTFNPLEGGPAAVATKVVAFEGSKKHPRRHRKR